MKPEKILIVNENEINRAAVKQLLGGCNVAEAACAGEAIALIGEEANGIAAVLLPSVVPEAEMSALLAAVHEAGRSIQVLLCADGAAWLRQNDDAGRLKSIIANINSSVSAVTVSDAGVVRFIFANDQYYAQLGYTRQQFEAEVGNAFEILHPDDMERIREAVSRVLSDGGNLSYEYRIIKRDNSIAYLRCDASVAHIAGVEEKVLLSVIYDITEQKNAEMEAARLTQELEAVLENINGGVTVTLIGESAPRILRANDQYYAQLGYTRRQFEAEVATPFDLVHPDDRERVAEQTQRASELAQAFSITYRAVRRDGCVRWMRSNISITSFPGVEGAVQLSVANDISELVEAEQKLSQSSERLQAIVGSIASGVTAVVMQDNGQLEFVFATDRYYELLGYTRRQYETELANAYDRIHPDDLAAMLAAIDEVNRTGKTATKEFRALRRDGAEIWLQVVMSRMRFAEIDKPVQLSVFTDITESRNLTGRLEVLTENIPGGLATIVVNGDGINIVYFNDGFYRYSGYSREEFAELVKDDALRLVFKEDVAGVYEVLKRFKAGDETAYCTYRCHTKSGGYCWFELKGAITASTGETLVINLVQFDVTQRKEAEEQLRISEEQFRIAAAIGGRSIARYDIKAGVYYHTDKTLFALGFDERIENVPQTFISRGNVAPECVADYLEFYEKIKRGEKHCSLDSAVLREDGKFCWSRREATVITDAEGRPSQAIIVITDITEQREKEAVFKKWQQSLNEKSTESYTLFRWNLSRDIMSDATAGSLLNFKIEPGPVTFNERTVDYALRFVYPDDRAAYIAFVSADGLLASYYRGKRYETLEYREMMPEGETRWLRLTVELVEYPNVSDVEAYLMYEDIDLQKRSELLAQERASMDALTGVLNRAAFVRELEETLSISNAAQHALLMMDIDGFKLLNDALGHAAGDKALIEVANSLRLVLRHGDILGRLGGDEFIICLKEIPYDAAIGKRAQQICELVRKNFNRNVQISASIGIAVYPRDGETFDELYRNADTALYSVKKSGKDNYAFYAQNMQGGQPLNGALAKQQRALKPAQDAKRRMLIVDDSDINLKLLERMFRNDFIIETAEDGGAALIRLRRFGTGISIVLLDLMMPGMDGFAVLEKMRASVEMRTIPVIVVSGTDERETSLRAIKCGASDFVTKPVDPDLIRLRVNAAISRSENERLRAQNSYLLLQSNEEAKYRSVLESTGTVVIEYDWTGGVFTYDVSIAGHIAGRFDERKLWHILLSDMVAEAKDVKAMQDLVHSVANNRRGSCGSMAVRLKTPEQGVHWFRMNVFKRVDEFQLANKMIITFNDINEERLADEKLRFHAERDALTGVYNRRMFLQRAEEMVRLKPAGSYLMSVGDVDNFKMVNDRYGHAEGDRLLKYIANMLAEDMKKVDGLCGRLGNDVFATLIPNLPATLERTKDYSKSLLASYPLELELTCSIGYYIVDNPSLPSDGMLDRASMAKQTAKGKYGAKVAWYDENMRQRLLSEQEIAGKMEAALNDGLFDIYLQPQFNHTSGQMQGAEALVRWLHPQKGVAFLPGEFIPLFERNGFITKLDEYIWNRTAELCGKWISEGCGPVPISVNVSRMDTHDPMLCDKLLDIVQKNGIPINLFRLEITESLFEEDTERLVAVIDKLHEAGFIIEMDDFGSGYSSLNVLKDVPVDVIKLDMRFFSRSDNNERSGAILNAVMRMARWLGISVIAEGVEEKEQADYLASIGCPVIQGYLYERPIPAAEFEGLLKANKEEAKPRAFSAAPVTKGLWALESGESVLFYNYMDAAAVFEYRDESIEVIRVNRRFLEAVNFNENLPLPTREPLGMHAEDVPVFMAAAKRAAASDGDEVVEVRKAPSGEEKEVWLHCTLRTVPGGAENAVILCNVSRIER